MESEQKYDKIMGQSQKIFEYQKEVGNAYAMHVAVEKAIEELNEKKEAQNQKLIQFIDYVASFDPEYCGQEQFKAIVKKAKSLKGEKETNQK